MPDPSNVSKVDGVVTKKTGFIELGDSGLKYSAGTIEEEFIAKIKDYDRRINTYKEMSLNDSTIAAVLFAIRMLIRSVSWPVEAASKDNVDQEAAEFLKSCQDDMSHTWTSFIDDALTMLEYGYEWSEIVYKMRKGGSKDSKFRSRFNDNRIGWRKFAGRSQDSLSEWDLDDNGGVKGFIQEIESTFTTVNIPIEKSLLFRTTERKNNPEGISILRFAFKDWWYKKRVQLVEAIGTEREFTGYPKIGVPAAYLDNSATAEQKNIVTQLRNMGRNFRADEQGYVLYPNDRDANGNEIVTFDSFKSPGTRKIDTGAIITRYDQRMAMSVLADFVLLGHNKVGSFALSSSKTRLFSTAIGSWLDSIGDVLNRFAVPRLFAINNFNVKELPKFAHSDIETPDLDILASFVSNLVRVGAITVPDESLEEHLREAADLPVNVAKQWPKELIKVLENTKQAIVGIIEEDRDIDLDDELEEGD